MGEGLHQGFGQSASKAYWRITFARTIGRAIPGMRYKKFIELIDKPQRVGIAPDSERLVNQAEDTLIQISFPLSVLTGTASSSFLMLNIATSSLNATKNFTDSLALNPLPSSIYIS